MFEDSVQTKAVVIILVIIGGAFVGGSVYFFNPFEDEINIRNAWFTDTDENNRADTLKLCIENRANLNTSVNKITLSIFGHDLLWSHNESIEIGPNSIFTAICQAENSTGELQFFDLVKITVFYKNKLATVLLRMGIEFSDLPFIYGHNFQQGFDYCNWTHFYFRNLTDGAIHGENTTIKSWKRQRDPIQLDKCLMCVTSNCQYIILNTTMFDFYDFNLSVDIRRRDNDGVGVILRYSEINDFPEFYILWHTLDHPIGDEEYLEEEAHMFNWTSEYDRIEYSKVTLHYVKGYDAGNGVIGFNWFKLNSTYCPVNDEWRNWRINLNGSRFSFSFDLTPQLTYDGLTLMNGTIGLASFESRGSSFDNLYIW
ncbi:MAG: hypothetical protein FK733_12835 [Asgard group archaeon]|nr:hypothetical protein [Asgard group archaeon]